MPFQRSTFDFQHAFNLGSSLVRLALTHKNFTFEICHNSFPLFDPPLSPKQYGACASCTTHFTFLCFGARTVTAHAVLCTPVSDDVGTQLHIPQRRHGFQHRPPFSAALSQHVHVEGMIESFHQSWSASTRRAFRKCLVPRCRRHSAMLRRLLVFIA